MNRLLALVVLLCLYTQHSFATIAVDTVTTRTSTGNSLSFSHTIGAGDNRLLMVGVSLWNDDNERVRNGNGVTYGGVNLTRVGRINRDDDSRVEIWAMVNPPVGSATVFVRFNGTVQRGAGAGAISFTGVDQTSPYDAFVSAQGDNRNPRITVNTDADNLVLAVMASESQDDTPKTEQGTEQWAYKASSGSSLGAAGAIATGATSQAFRWESEDSDDWVVGAVSINPASSTTPPGPVVCQTYRDEFTATNFANNQGTLNWVGDWVEFDIDGNGPTTGDVRVVSNRLRITGKDNRINNNSIARQFSGNGYTSATLTFDYDASSGLESDDRMYVELSDDGGSSFTSLDILQNLNGNPSTRQYSRDITRFLANDMRLRFRVFEDNGSGNCCFGPDSEYIDFDNIQIEVCQAAPQVLPAPVLNYTFDQCTLDSGVEDSANNFDGTATNTNSADAQAVIQRSLDLSAQGTGDYVTADSAAFNGLDNFTLSVWIKTGVSKSQQEIFQALGSSTGDDEIEIYLVNSNQVRVNIRDRGNTIDAGTTLTDDNWHHLAITRNAETVCLYVDGQFAGCHGDGRSGQIQINNSNSAIIGQEQDAFGGSFNSGQAFEGFMDEFTLYDEQLSGDLINQIFVNEGAGDNADGTTRDQTCAALPLAYYSITHPAAGLTCDTSRVTITACADATCAPFPDPVTISFPETESTRRNYTFINQIEVDVSRNTAGPLTLDISPVDAQSVAEGPTQCSGGCSIDFRDAAFVFVDRNNNFSTALPDIIAESNLSGIGLRAVENNQGVCQAALSGNQQVTLGFDCVSDGASYSPNQCRVPFAGVPVQGDGTGVSSASITLNFDSNGVASLPGRYDDAGRLALFASGTFNGFSLTSGPVGTQFDSIPQRIELAAQAPALYVAGNPFSLSLQALGQIGAQPLPSYAAGQLEYTYQRVTPNAVLANSFEARLALGADATLVSATSPSFTAVNGLGFNNGEYATSLASSSEVGEYLLTFRDANYLGNLVSGNSNTLGRFIPAYFSVAANTPRLEAACNNFSYIGQPSDFALGAEPLFTVTAFNADSQVTRLYSDTHWRLNPSVNEVTAGLSLADQAAFSLTVTADTSALNLDINNIDSFTGTGEIRVRDVPVTYQKAPIPNTNFAPFNSQFSVSLPASIFTDADNVCFRENYVDETNRGSCSGITVNNIGSVEQRYGRLSLTNTYGAETRALRLPMQAEYYNRGNWLINTLDNCTAINLTQLAGDIDIANGSSAGEANIAGQYLTTVSTGVLDAGLSSLDDLVFAPPLNGERGSIRVTLDPTSSLAVWPEFLNIDWNNDGTIDDNDAPSALVSFGLYRGNDRLFHSRELTGED